MSTDRSVVHRFTGVPARNLADWTDLGPQIGGQFEWFWGVPSVFHALAAPDAAHPLPAAPVEESDHAQHLGYWSALQYLLLRRLGWRYPASGLTWWYDNGKPVQDPTLALIKSCWDQNANLDMYLAWLLTSPRYFALEAQPAVSFAQAAPAAPERWRRWAEDQMRNAPSFTGGWDPLHLTRHLGEDGDPDPNAVLAVLDREGHRAALLTSRVDSWYGDLMRHGESLPVLHSKAWRVEVHVRPVGYLGTYRRSWDTGLWFTGSHQTHAAGNRPEIGAAEG